MLDYKTIITQRYALHMSGRQIADTLGVSKSGVNDFLKAFETCETLSYPLPKGITNYGIYSQVYGKPDPVSADSGFVMPDYSFVDKELTGRKNMTLIFLWGRYKNQCIADEAKFYSYRQFCSRYADWIQSHSESLHLNAVAGEKLEVDFAGNRQTHRRSPYDCRVCIGPPILAVHLCRGNAVHEGIRLDLCQQPHAGVLRRSNPAGSLQQLQTGCHSE